MSKVISLDLELNPVSKKIIQIGYVICELRTNTILRKRSLIVNPEEPLQVIQELGIHISDYTGITETRIKFDGRSLKDAYNILVMDIEELKPTRTCVQWGMGDIEHLRKQLNMSHDDYIFRNRVWDVKSLYQIHRLFHNQSVACGLGKAIENLGMTFEGRPHDAMDDALNTYRLFYELGRRSSMFDKINKLVNGT